MKRKPNVMLIFVDDLGYGDVSAFNPESKLQTVNIDRLAKRGMRFTDSHATSALCTPSRYGLLTGRYNWRSRLKSFVLPGDSETLIEKDRRTIAHLLKDAGYQTAVIGKWHLGLDWQLLGYKNYDSYQIDPACLPEESEPRQAEMVILTLRACGSASMDWTSIMTNRYCLVLINMALITSSEPLLLSISLPLYILKMTVSWKSPL